MLETIAALLLAHALADFVFQTRHMAANKHRLVPLALHGATVFALSFAALGLNLWPALFVASLHILIDYAKARMGDGRLSHFLADQSAHGLVIVAAALLWPQGYGSLAFFIADQTTTVPLNPPDMLALVAGLILATRMGQFLVGKLMAPFAPAIHEEDGLPNGGALIGLLERGLTFIFVLAGQTTGVGLLIAAKSFLRVGTANESRKMAEYVIIGTLASIGWALLMAYGTQSALTLLRDG